MPRDLFAQTLSPPPRHSKSRWTLAGSLIGHTALIAALVIAPMLAPIDGPEIVSSLKAFVVELPPAAAPPPSALPATAKAVRDLNPRSTPLSTPDEIRTETPPATGVGPAIPGAGSIAGVSHPLSSLVQSDARLEPPPAPRPREPVRPGGVVQEPRRLFYVAPVYPEIARQARIGGTVVLEAIIDESGGVRDVKVLRSVELLDRAAVEAVRKWRYMPTRLNGVAVPILMTVTVTFSLQ
jgi:protein TonB